MGYAAIGTHTEGWTLLDGELLPSDLADLGLETDAPAPEYKRGPRSPRFTRSAIPTAQEAEIANKLSRAASEVTIWEAFLKVARSMGMSEQDAAESFQALHPIPEPALSIACREGRHWAADRPEGSCNGKRLTADYDWAPCECPMCHKG